MIQAGRLRYIQGDGQRPFPFLEHVCARFRLAGHWASRRANAAGMDRSFGEKCCGRSGLGIAL